MVTNSIFCSLLGQLALALHPHYDFTDLCNIMSIVGCILSAAIHDVDQINSIHVQLEEILPETCITENPSMSRVIGK